MKLFLCLQGGTEKPFPYDPFFKGIWYIVVIGESFNDIGSKPRGASNSHILTSKNNTQRSMRALRLWCATRGEKVLEYALLFREYKDRYIIFFSSDLHTCSRVFFSFQRKPKRVLVGLFFLGEF